MLLCARQGSDAGFLFVPPAILSIGPSSVGSYPGATLAGTQAEFTVEDFCFMYGPYKTYEDRFWSKVDKSEACWLWTAGTMQGYGVFSTRVNGKGKMHRAHRYAFELVHGPIADGLTLDHLCHTQDDSCMGGNSCPHRRCVNPDHLEPTSGTDNVLRGRSLAALNFRKTHCLRGHQFTPTNTYLTKNGGRACLTCRHNYYRANYIPHPRQKHHNSQKIYCKNGHLFTAENTYVNGGSRFCRVCRKAYAAIYYQEVTKQ